MSVRRSRTTPPPTLPRRQRPSTLSDIGRTVLRRVISKRSLPRVLVRGIAMTDVCANADVPKASAIVSPQSLIIPLRLHIHRHESELIVVAQDIATAEVRMLEPLIVRYINRQLGYRAVDRLRVLPPPHSPDRRPPILHKRPPS